jgi:hypothetical protein
MPTIEPARVDGGILRALWLRELRVSLFSPAGAFLLGVWAFFVGALSMTELFAFEQAEQRALALDDPSIVALIDVNTLLLASVMNNLTIVLLFLGPLIALRQWSDGHAREWLLLRSPTPLHLVLARSAASALGIAILVGVTWGLPAFLAMVGRPVSGEGVVVDLGQTLTMSGVVALAGITFVVVSAAAVVAIDQGVVGALVAFVMLTVLWLLPSAEPLLGPTLGPLVSQLSPAVHLEPALRGVVDVGDVLYWILLCAAAIAATTGVLQGRMR